jgi:ABC-type transport system involved in cytochrome bd biosynthesis fused ATPase/permease subunit
MGYLVAIGCFILLSMISSNRGLLLVLIPVVLLVILFRSQAKKTRLKAELEREKLREAQAAELAEQKRIEAIEAQRRWNKEKAKQQQNRIQRVNRARENFRIVSEVCGVCGSKLNAKGICISGCKPLEE